MLKNNFYKSILLILIATLFGAIMIAIIKYVQNDINIHITCFFRFFFGLLIIIPYHLITFLKYLKTNILHLHFLRSILNYPAMYFGFTAIYLIPLETNAAITFSTPIFVSIIAILLFHEKISKYRILSLFFGFIGILIVIRPGIIELEIGVVYSIASCIFWSLCVILTKKMVHFDSPLTIITYMYIFMTIITSIFAYYNWTLPDNMTLFLLFLGALCGTIFHLLTNHAYKISELTFLMPFNYVNIIINSIIGYILFQDHPDLFTWIGAGLIVSSLSIGTYLDSKKNIN